MQQDFQSLGAPSGWFIVLEGFTTIIGDKWLKKEEESNDKWKTKKRENWQKIKENPFFIYFKFQ